MGSRARSPAVISALVFVGLLIAYNANGTVLLGNDTKAARFTAVSLLKRGDLDLDEFADMLKAPGVAEWPPWTAVTPHGVVSIFNFGSAIAATPVIAVGLAAGDGQLGETEAMYLAKLASSIYVAAAAAFLFLTALQLGASRRAGLTVALLYGLGTCAFSVVAQALWQHGPAEFFLVLGAYLLARGGRAALIGSGAAFAAVVVCRPPDFVFALAALAYVIVHRRAGILGFVLGALPLAAAQAIYSLYYFGSPFYFGQLEPATSGVAMWSANGALMHLAGLLVSPSRGLFIYSPFFVFLGLTRWREIAPVGRFLLGGVVALVLMTACYYEWYGGWCFGYRTIVDASPILCLALVPVLPRLGRLVVPFAVAVVASLIIHTIGAYCYDAYQWDASPDVDHHQERLWSVEGSQLVYWIQHARLRERP